MQKQQQLQHQQFQRQMEEKLELLQKQQLLFQPPGDLLPDGDFLEVARGRGESSGQSSTNATPRASNHSNLSHSEPGGSAAEHEEGGKHPKQFWIILRASISLYICLFLEDDHT